MLNCRLHFLCHNSARASVSPYVSTGVELQVFAICFNWKNRCAAPAGRAAGSRREGSRTSPQPAEVARHLVLRGALTVPEKAVRTQPRAGGRRGGCRLYVGQPRRTDRGTNARSLWR